MPFCSAASGSDTTSLKRPVSSQSGSIDRYGRQNERSTGIFDSKPKQTADSSRIYEPVDSSIYRPKPNRQSQGGDTSLSRQPDKRDSARSSGTYGYRDSSSSLNRQQDASSRGDQKRPDERASGYPARDVARHDSSKGSQPEPAYRQTRSKF